MMEYKGYVGRVTAVDEKQALLHGEVADLRDVITFQGKTVEELLQAFHDSVDDYLAFCDDLAQSPESSLPLSR